MEKVLCLIDNLGPGGAQRQLVGLATFLKEKGNEVSVVFYDNNCFYIGLLQAQGVQYVYLEKAQKTVFRIWHVARFIRKMKPDWVVSYLETPSICACVARVFNHRFKLIVSERNTTQHTGRSEKIRFNLFRIVDFVVPNSFAQEDYIRKSFPILSSKVVTIPNFVDLDHFVPPVERHRREIPEIMVAATIWPSKNTIGFIDAVAVLKDRGYQFHISWYGLNNIHIDYINRCRQKIERLGVVNFIELKGKTTKIKELYQDADFFCLPSLYEGTPNVICEAMACGLPILCSDVCDNSKYVVGGDNGFLFNPEEVDSIVAAFERMFALSEEEYEYFCHRSREQAELKMSKEAFVDAYIKLIER